MRTRLSTLSLALLGAAAVSFVHIGTPSDTDRASSRDRSRHLLDVRAEPSRPRGLSASRSDSVRGIEGDRAQGAVARAPEASRVAPAREAKDPKPQRSLRVRVRVQVLAGDSDVAPQIRSALPVPVPELLRIGAHGVARRVRATTSTVDVDTDDKTSEASFVLHRAGRFVAAWHAWLSVPGTRTRRVCRGRGEEIAWDGLEDVERLLVLRIPQSAIHLDPELDRAAPNPSTTLHAKDGD